VTFAATFKRKLSSVTCASTFTFTTCKHVQTKSCDSILWKLLLGVDDSVPDEVNQLEQRVLILRQVVKALDLHRVDLAVDVRIQQHSDWTVQSVVQILRGNDSARNTSLIYYFKSLEKTLGMVGVQHFVSNGDGRMHIERKFVCVRILDAAKVGFSGIRSKTLSWQWALPWQQTHRAPILHCNFVIRLIVRALIRL